MKRPTLALALVAEVAALAYLGYLATRDGYVNALPLGVCLLVMAAAAIVVYLITHPVAGPWPDDLGDVWDDEEEPTSDAEDVEAELTAEELPCPEREHVHDPHSWTDESDPGDDRYWCPGVFMERDCDDTTPHGRHLWPDPEFPTEPWQCRGVKAPEPVLEPTEDPSGN